MSKRYKNNKNKANKKKSTHTTHPYVELIQTEITTLEEKLKTFEEESELTNEQQTEQLVTKACLERYKDTLNKTSDPTTISKVGSYQGVVIDESRKKQELSILTTMQLFYLMRLGQLGLFDYMEPTNVVPLDSIADLCDQIIGAAVHHANEKVPKLKQENKSKVFSLIRKLDTAADEVIGTDKSTFKQVKEFLDHLWQHTTTVEGAHPDYPILQFDTMMPLPTNTTKSEPKQDEPKVEQHDEPVQQVGQHDKPVQDVKVEQQVEPVKDVKQHDDTVKDLKQHDEPVQEVKEHNEPVQDTKQRDEPVQDTKQRDEPVQDTKKDNEHTQGTEKHSDEQPETPETSLSTTPQEQQAMEEKKDEGWGNIERSGTKDGWGSSEDPNKKCAWGNDTLVNQMDHVQSTEKSHNNKNLTESSSNTTSSSRGEKKKRNKNYKSKRVVDVEEEEVKKKQGGTRRSISPPKETSKQSQNDEDTKKSTKKDNWKQPRESDESVNTTTIKEGGWDSPGESSKPAGEKDWEELKNNFGTITLTEDPPITTEDDSWKQNYHDRGRGRGRGQRGQRGGNRGRGEFRGSFRGSGRPPRGRGQRYEHHE